MLRSASIEEARVSSSEVRTPGWWAVRVIGALVIAAVLLMLSKDLYELILYW